MLALRTEAGPGVRAVERADPTRDRRPDSPSSKQDLGEDSEAVAARAQEHPPPDRPGVSSPAERRTVLILACQRSGKTLMLDLFAEESVLGISDRVSPARRAGDNREPPVPEGDAGFVPRSDVFGASMCKVGAHSRHLPRIDRALEVDDLGETAHHLKPTKSAPPPNGGRRGHLCRCGS